MDLTVLLMLESPVDDDIFPFLKKKKKYIMNGEGKYIFLVILKIR